METVAGLPMHEGVSTRAVARRTDIPYTTVSVAQRPILLSYLYKIQHRHELLPGDFVKRRAFAVWAFQKLTEDDDWLSKELWTNEAYFTLRGSGNFHN